jgi:hypothetical protein
MHPDPRGNPSPNLDWRAHAAGVLAIAASRSRTLTLFPLERFNDSRRVIKPCQSSQQPAPYLPLW